MFYAYSHKDEALRDELEEHLALLKRQGYIVGWHDRRIGAGEEWKGQLDKNLEESQIILLLISPSFLASDYCYDIETKRALDRHDKGEATVIPVILRSVDWRNSPFGKLRALPSNARPVTVWENRDEVFTNIAQGLRRTIDELYRQPQSYAGADRSGRAVAFDPLGDSELVEAIKARNVLFVSAGLNDENRKHLDEHFRKITERLERTKSREKFRFFVRLADTYGELRPLLLEHEPEILHLVGMFTGNSEESPGIALETGVRGTASPNLDTLAQLFGLSNSSLKCVILSSSFTENDARIIFRFIDYVIRIGSLNNAPAFIEFSVAFYNSLFSGRDYVDSYMFGHNAIQLMGGNIEQSPIFIINKQSSYNYKLEEVFKTSGVPSVTFVSPEVYSRLLVALRTPGRGVVIEGPSGIGKTTAVIKGLEHLGLFSRTTRYRSRIPNDRDAISKLPRTKNAGVVVIDDFHVLDDITKKEIGDYVKVLADRGGPRH